MKHLMVCMCIGISSAYSHAQTERFITIIGPDGFPMVVPYSEKKKQQVEPNKKQVNKPNKIEEVVVPLPALVNEISFPSVKQHKESIIQLNSSTDTLANPKSTDNHLSGISKVEVAKPSLNQKRTNAQTSQSSQATTEKSDKVLVKEQPISEIKKPLINNQAQKDTAITNSRSPYVLVDGEKYYDAEYLEQNEFNLEGKSRFYQIPMAGSGGSNWNIIERKKGVDMSWFNWRNKAQQAAQQEVVALGEHYQVLSAEVLEEVLPTRCLNTKELKKAKALKDQIVSFWPRAPLNDDFDFELLALNQQKVKNLKITSFAKSEKQETYYWPLVIFLDQKGCVTEGVSNYFTKDYSATMLQQTAIEGIIQLPENTHYVLFTPLESSIDVPHKKLSNKGQMSLTVLR